MRLLQTLLFYTIVIICSISQGAPSTELIPGSLPLIPQAIESGPDDILLLRKQKRFQYQGALGLYGGNLIAAGENLSLAFLNYRGEYLDSVEHHSLFSVGLTQKSYFVLEAGKKSYFQDPIMGVSYWKYSLATILVPAEGISTFGALKRIQLQSGWGIEKIGSSHLDFEISLAYALIGFSAQAQILAPLFF